MLLVLYKLFHRFRANEKINLKNGKIVGIFNINEQEKSLINENSYITDGMERIVRVYLMTF